jgi:hypothetical protein
MAEYSNEEIKKRRTEALRQMLSTPPQQHATSRPQAAKTRKKADLQEVKSHEKKKT